MADLTLAQATAAGWISSQGLATATTAAGVYTMFKVVGPATEPSGNFTTAAAGSGRSSQRVHEFATTQAQLLSQITDYENFRTALP